MAKKNKKSAKVRTKAKKSGKKAKLRSKKAKKAKKVKNRRPRSGQSGPRIELAREKMNPKELRVLTVLNGGGKGERKATELSALANKCFASKGKKKANSWVRNSLRRLVRGGWVEKSDSGTYKISEKGRKRATRKGASKTKAKAKAKATSPKLVSVPQAATAAAA